MLSVLHSQYHACWCSSNFRRQDISMHGIDTQSPNIPSPASEVLMNPGPFSWYIWFRIPSGIGLEFVGQNICQRKISHCITKNYNYHKISNVHLIIETSFGICLGEGQNLHVLYWEVYWITFWNTKPTSQICWEWVIIGHVAVMPRCGWRNIEFITVHGLNKGHIDGSVTPLLTHCSYCSLALIHRYNTFKMQEVYTYYKGTPW